jgi:hypothetical protein
VREALSNDVFARRGRVLLARFWGVREAPFGGCNKGNNNRPLNQRLRGRMGS